MRAHGVLPYFAGNQRRDAGQQQGFVGYAQLLGKYEYVVKGWWCHTDLTQGCIQPQHSAAQTLQDGLVVLMLTSIPPL